MATINVADLQSGMVLEEDLKSPQGRLLLPAGTVLTERHLSICKIWGVIEAQVAGVDSEEVEERTLDGLDSERLAASRKLMARRFAHADMKHPMLRELARQAVKLTAQRYDSLRLPLEMADKENCSQQEKPPRLRDLVDGQGELASLPAIFNHIIDAINSPRTSAAYVADVISKDVGLSAKLLKLVNSPLYGMQRVDTLSRAVTIIGSNHLTNLALGISVITQFQDIPTGLINMERFWHHSVLTGVWAKLLAGQLRFPGEERCFVSGLLHDAGRLLMLRGAPGCYCSLLRLAGPKTNVLYELERESFGYDHAQVGGALLDTWRFPEELVQAVRGHHAPMAGHSTLTEACIVHVADITAHCLQDEVGGPLDLVPPLAADAWESLGLNKNAFAPLIPHAEHQLSEIMRIFFNHDVG